MLRSRHYEMFVLNYPPPPCTSDKIMQAQHVFQSTCNIKILMGSLNVKDTALLPVELF